MDRQIGAVSVMMRSIYVPTLTYGRELWIVTERKRLSIEAPEIGFLG